MSIYDLYQSYLNQLQNPVVQQSPLFDYRFTISTSTTRWW
jgi:hypothetical protein